MQVAEKFAVVTINNSVLSNSQPSEVSLGPRNTQYGGQTTVVGVGVGTDGGALKGVQCQHLKGISVGGIR